MEKFNRNWLISIYQKSADKIGSSVKFTKDMTDKQIESNFNLLKLDSRLYGDGDITNPDKNVVIEVLGNAITNQKILSFTDDDKLKKFELMRTLRPSGEEFMVQNLPNLTSRSMDTQKNIEAISGIPDWKTYVAWWTFTISGDVLTADIITDWISVNSSQPLNMTNITLSKLANSFSIFYAKKINDEINTWEANAKLKILNYDMSGISDDEVAGEYIYKNLNIQLDLLTTQPTNYGVPVALTKQVNTRSRKNFIIINGIYNASNIKVSYLNNKYPGQNSTIGASGENVDLGVKAWITTILNGEDQNKRNYKSFIIDEDYYKWGMFEFTKNTYLGIGFFDIITVHTFFGSLIIEEAQALLLNWNGTPPAKKELEKLQALKIKNYKLLLYGKDGSADKPKKGSLFHSSFQTFGKRINGKKIGTKQITESLEQYTKKLENLINFDTDKLINSDYKAEPKEINNIATVLNKISTTLDNKQSVQDITTELEKKLNDKTKLLDDKTKLLDDKIKLLDDKNKEFNIKFNKLNDKKTEETNKEIKLKDK